jgi:hypothetical protein
VSSETRSQSVPQGRVRSYVFSFTAVPTAILSSVLVPTAASPVATAVSSPAYQYDAASIVGRDLDRRRILQGLGRYRGMQTERNVRRLKGRLVRRQERRPLVDSFDDIRAMLVDLD